MPSGPPPTPPKDDRFTRLPAELAAKSRTVRLASNIPALLAHPDWSSPAPAVLWLHGRTVNKELDSGRYLRWIRAGIAACAIDLPGHGQRAHPGDDSPARSLDIMQQAIAEIDHIVEALADPAWNNVFDLDRLAIGGMSLGGMITLRRLCDDHPFKAAAVESTTGWLTAQYFPKSTHIPELANITPWPVDHPREKVEALDAMKHLDTFRPIPMLVLHSESDRVISWPVQRRFVEALRAHYRTTPQPATQTPPTVELLTWPSTGAPDEHSGFGRFSNDAKNAQTDFFAKTLGARAPGA
jgi:alpha-beta hydrolase superfamily lysophospholipase